MIPPDLGTTSIGMLALHRLVLLAGCGMCASIIPAASGRDPAAPYLGMTQAEIIACAGEPHSRFKSGADAETLTYHYSGDGPVPAPLEKDGEKKKKDKPSFSFGGKKKDKDWTCSATMVFEGGKLVRVNFAHKDVRSPYAWQAVKDPKKQEEKRNEPNPTCTFSLPRCAR
jgi:hypothetical protein